MEKKQIKCNKKGCLVNFYNSSLKYSSKKRSRAPFYKRPYIPKSIGTGEWLCLQSHRNYIKTHWNPQEDWTIWYNKIYRQRPMRGIGGGDKIDVL